MNADAFVVRKVPPTEPCPRLSDNLICLCPNHHTLFELGCFMIANDLSLIGIEGRLHIHATHTLNGAHLKNHRDHYSPQE
jgi:putative restriction endonuclease